MNLDSTYGVVLIFAAIALVIGQLRFGSMKGLRAANEDLRKDLGTERLRADRLESEAESMKAQLAQMRLEVQTLRTLVEGPSIEDIRSVVDTSAQRVIEALTR